MPDRDHPVAKARAARIALAAVLLLAAVAFALAIQSTREAKRAAGKATRSADALARVVAAQRDALIAGCERGNVQRQVIREYILRGDLDAAKLVSQTSTSAALRAYYSRIRVPRLTEAVALPQIAEQDCRALYGAP
jgi:predicted outer membrane protein